MCLVQDHCHLLVLDQDQSFPDQSTVIKPQKMYKTSLVFHSQTILNNNTQGISFNEVGGNPWQPEIFFTEDILLAPLPGIHKVYLFL